MDKNIALIALLLFLCTHQITQYKIINQNITDSTIILDLAYTGTQTTYQKQKNYIVKNLKFILKCHTRLDFTFKIIDVNNQRFQTLRGTPFSVDEQENFTFPIAYSDFSLTYNKNPFEFEIKRRLSQETIFNSNQNDLIYTQYFIQIGTSVKTKYLYGFGERFSKFRVFSGNFTIMGSDSDEIDPGELGYSTYGHYPIYLNQQQTKFWDIAHFRNSNPMTIEINNKENGYQIHYRTIGGIIEFRYFLGENYIARDTIERYLKSIGKSAIPPFWALGYHQSRWGYSNITDLKNVILNFELNSLPLDTLWLDLDYMIQTVDFTLDEIRFPNKELKLINQKYKIIPITHGQIPIKQGFIPYSEGIQRKIFIKSAQGDLQYGRQRSGDVHFIDFLHPEAENYWKDMLKFLQKIIPFDGVWHDMNQYNNYCDGNCHLSTNPSIFDYSTDIPYSILAQGDSVQNNNLSFNSSVYLNITYANVAGYMSLLQTKASFQFFKEKALRPFILSRASISGLNQYGIHWTGDDHTQFQYLKISIGGNFLGGLWGFQMIGADICGFVGNASDQLCSRWYQVGSMYTFSRNHHNSRRLNFQQPYLVGPNTLISAKTNLRLRYSILKHLYTEFIFSRGIGLIWKPLFYDFSDPQILNQQVQGTQFLLGNSLMCTPIIQEGKISKNSYFPSVRWYDIPSGKMFEPYQYYLINNTMIQQIPLFLKDGRIIFFQNVQNITQTKQLSNVFSLYIGLNNIDSSETIKTYKSNGNILSIDQYENEEYIQTCLMNGCFYEIQSVYTKDIVKQQIIINVIYIGDSNLNKKLIINELVLFIEGTKIKYPLRSQINITKTQSFVINLNMQSIN